MLACWRKAKPVISDVLNTTKKFKQDSECLEGTQVGKHVEGVENGDRFPGEAQSDDKLKLPNAKFCRS